ncbi:NADPH:quinone oxidoreductase family protein [Deinococcus maricopensis]|uniref:NADPH:quinone reductase n=1 Tax=Deinococcus maricopensis (strain DSM 21211 / LMG 22137 / NRRL B-23946 / LB-34) TaxID=709986 RepID=E8U6G2_DEIML|nr:NADPH:quinone oxidoreductase family protein [Deinococcus maricopensis]ADV66651.1 NADPH:quinone reductase [Deinococcus maricopensis DSM 21211]
MDAVVCRAWGPPESLVVESQPEPVAGAGEVVLAVRAASVNFPDVLMIQGKYQVRPELPFTPGAEAAGVVLSVGEGVRHVRPGDRAVAFVGHGAFAEQLRAPASAVMPLPDEVPFDVAAAFTLAYGTSYHALVDRAHLRDGETLLVLGAAGGVGLAAVEIGRALGARVIAAASTAEKLAVCTEHGADEVINYEAEDLRARLKDLTGGRGPDVIYDPVGGRFAEAAFRSIGWGGRYLVVGFAAGDIPSLPLNLPLLKGASLVGVFWGEFARRDPRGNAANLARMLAWMGEGRIRPRISARYALADTSRALLDMAERRVTGKVVIQP